MNPLWKQVDEYYSDKLHAMDPVMASVLKANNEAGLPSIDVSPLQGKQLYLLAKLKGAKNILEIGTLGGFSTIWLARALPEDGRLVTLEFSEKHAAVAHENLRRAGVDQKVDILVGPALDTLPKLHDKGFSDFDFVFIDADKRNNPGYLQWSLDLVISGAVIVGDNVIRNGRVVEENSEDEGIKGIREFADLLAADTRIESTAVQTVGSKGYDGFVLAVVQK
ncbi:O-methyltransferase [Halobacillus salinarum]|uniref:O-methyltransferase n=1 Tax=Halobacillus salinarum TaxID=2932257 RepID=A0ABY4ENB4_9BACI|nr:O-methyltransferase [Halobacillus salinarum]UOQ45952.1 O-methyltransferase [Halobacillus salinarum]